jgi:hypothetical protein
MTVHESISSLQEISTFLIIQQKGIDVMADTRVRAGRFGGIAAVFIAAAVLLFPSTPTVLCVVPGGHVEIEDMDGHCCMNPSVSAPVGVQPDNGFNSPANCRNCTDLFLTPYGRGAVLASLHHTAANPLAAECLENHIPTESSPPLCRSDALARMTATIPVSSSVPLRC